MDIQRIRLLWNKHAQTRYNDVVGKARKAHIKPTWIESKPWNSWKEVWNTLEFLAEKQRRNRAANPHLHTSGSRSHSQVPKDLVKELQREPTPLELHMKTHKRKVDGEFVDSHSHEVAERSRQIIAQKSSQSGTPPSYQDECDAYLEVVGGVGPGGSVSGLGSAAAEYYRDQIRAPRKEAPGVAELQRENATLRAQVATLKETQTTLEETQTTQASQIQSTAAQLEATNQQLQILQRFMEQFQANRLSDSNLPPPNEDN